MQGKPVRRIVLALLLLSASSSAARVPSTPGPGGPPHPDPAFIEQVPGAPCTVENPYEANAYGLKVGDVRYGDKCKRIRFAFGPIQVKPGENDAILEPVTIEKPAYAGYITRFKPDLVDATGEHPDTDEMHLHHATWLNAYPSYGSGPFFAAGEEKTIAIFPKGYGMAVNAADTWLLLYMVHNAGTSTRTVWITYDIDYIKKADGDAMGIAPIKPIWLDVQKDRIHPEAPSTSANPVFNVQRGFGHVDPETGRRVCSWPKENCARFDTYGNVTPQQGKTVDSSGRPIEIAGADWRVPAHLAGTLVGLGGHLHPGGIRDEVSLVRDGVEKSIFISDALYWDFDDPNKVGAPPHSWNMSMTVAGAPWWKVKIRQGDVIRLNAVVDSQDASWYEAMGIVVAYVAPNDPHAPAGVDVFDGDVVIDRGVSATALVPDGPWDANGWRPEVCEPDLIGGDADGKRLCLRGQVTHGAVPESAERGGCPPAGCQALPTKEGRVVDQVVSAGFTYGEADLGVVGVTGIPQLKKGVAAKFWNYDTVARVWHTFTRCQAPCTGATGVAYPLADGGRGTPDDVMDFDSTQIGYGLMWEPASGQFGGGHGKSMQETVQDGLYWEFTPTETGTYTFWCRIHPSMRGAVKVVD